MPLNNQSADIILSSNDSIWHFEFLEWDTKFFQTPSFRLHTQDSKISYAPESIQILRNSLPDGFITAKLPYFVDSRIISQLQACGFSFIDTELLLENDDPKTFRPPEDDEFEFLELSAVPEDWINHGKQVFAYSRFHQDPKIDDHQADKLWVGYLANFSSDSSHRIFSIRSEEKYLGLILVNIEQRTKEACLFFVAVQSAARGLGIGSRLIQKTFQTLHEYRCYTEVYSRNLMALNFYLRNGMNMIKSTQSVLHRWKK